MARVISYTILAKDKFSKVANNITKRVTKLGVSIGVLTDSVKTNNKAWESLGNTVQKVGRWMSIASGGWVALSTKAVITSGKMASLQTAFIGITGSMQLGQDVMKDLLEFASKTPFEIEGLSKAAKQLVATGTATKDLVEELQLLGDIASIGGVPIRQISKAYTDIRGRPTLAAQDAYQLINAGIPVFDLLAKKISVLSRQNITAGMVRGGMGEGAGIPSKFVLDTLRELNKEGGVAYRAMILQSSEIPGLWSNINDEMFQTLGIAGNILGEFYGVKSKMRGFTEFLGEFRVWMMDMSTNHPIITSIFLSIITFFAALGPILAIFGKLIVHFIFMGLAIKALGYATGGAVQGFGLLKTAFIAIRMAIVTALPYMASGAIAFGWIALAVIGLISALAILVYYWDDVVKFFKESWAWIEDKFSKMSSFYSDEMQASFQSKIESNAQSESRLTVTLNDPASAVKETAWESTHMNIGYAMGM